MHGILLKRWLWWTTKIRYIPNQNLKVKISDAYLWWVGSHFTFQTIPHPNIFHSLAKSRIFIRICIFALISANRLDYKIRLNAGNTQSFHFSKFSQSIGGSYACWLQRNVSLKAQTCSERHQFLVLETEHRDKTILAVLTAKCETGCMLVK